MRRDTFPVNCNARMETKESQLREHAVAIWQAAVDAVRPEELLGPALADRALEISAAIDQAPRVLVFGAGKAGAAMTAALEHALANYRGAVTGIVNVPAGPAPPLRRVRLHVARPAASNQPTAEGIAGAEYMLELARSAGAEDVALCLLSGGGSALLPAPVPGVSLADKQSLTQILHACGATINEMNAVRKHLSRIKGGRLAQAFTGRALFSLIISDVIGDPLDVIASGPTAPDPTTFADALNVMERYALADKTPAAILDHLRRGAAGLIPETPKALPANVHNMILGNNERALAAARTRAEQLGYHVVHLGSAIQGDTGAAAESMVRTLQTARHAMSGPVCILSGGETTVKLPAEHGLGGRNQEFVLAMAHELEREGLAGVAVLSGGTDGEDGPTDAAGAMASAETLARAGLLGLNPGDYLLRHDAYHFFEAVGGLLKTGLTGTNVMDVHVILANPPR
jgi:glycerate 2-kinase